MPNGEADEPGNAPGSEGGKGVGSKVGIGGGESATGRVAAVSTGPDWSRTFVLGGVLGATRGEVAATGAFAAAVVFGKALARIGSPAGGFASACRAPGTLARSPTCAWLTRRVRTSFSSIPGEPGSRTFPSAYRSTR